MSIIFRDYQEQFIGNLAAGLTRVRKIIGQLSTGGGKTVIFSGICKRYLDKNGDKSVLILVHRKKLLKQTRRTLYNAFGIDCQIIVAGMRHVPIARVYVGMVESVTRRIDRIHNIGLVIIDECHVANFNKIHPFFPTQSIIGFTATPLATSKKDPLKNYYEDIVCGIDISELIELNKREPGQGLCQNITFAPKDVVDRAKLALSSTGDFQEGLMSLEFSKPRYVRNVITEYEKRAKKTKTIVFNVTIEHSKTVRDAFIGAGFDCRHIDGEMNDTEQTHIWNWYENTPNAILCNVGVATTGVDVPSIETVIVNVSTTSLTKWLQMCGRGGRPTPSKIMFTIIDMGGNAVVHGDWCDPRNWYDIFHNPPKPGEARDQVAPVKMCPSCEAIIPAPARTCKYCLYVFPIAPPKPEDEVGEMVLITKGIDVKELITRNKDKKKYVAFYAIGKELAKNAKKYFKEMTDSQAEFIYKSYIDLAREWADDYHDKLVKWHYTEAKKCLYEELRNRYPQWKNGSQIATPEIIEGLPIKVDATNILTPLAVNLTDLPDFSTFYTHFKNLL